MFFRCVEIGGGWFLRTIKADEFEMNELLQYVKSKMIIIGGRL